MNGGPAHLFALQLLPSNLHHPNDLKFLDNNLPPVVLSLVNFSPHPQQYPPDPSAPALFSVLTSNLQQHLTSVFSCTSALLIHNGALQTLCFQNVPHSFPSNGGGWAFAGFKPSDVQRAAVLPSFSLQRLTNCPICKSFVFKFIQHAGGVYM